MSKYLAIFAGLVVFLNVIFGAWTVLNGDVRFKSDVARDFLLFQEIAQKKIVLLGPRASGVMGVYHGPLWLYLTYPAYLLGSGNPVVVGYYWIGLVLAGLVVGFIVAKKLFSQQAAWIYAILLSGFFIQESKGLINPHGALLLMPVFYFFLVRYLETAKARYLFFHILTAGALIQFQMAIGLPITLLSAALVTYFIFRRKNFVHLLLFLTIALPLLTFIIFELRHNFAQTLAILGSNKQDELLAGEFSSSVLQRVQLAIGGSFHIFTTPFEKLALIPTLIFGYFLLTKAKHLPKKIQRRYTLFFYLLFCTFAMTLVIPGIMMSHQWIPLASLAMLLFASLVQYIDKRVFIVVVALVTLQSAYLWRQEGVSFSQENENRFDSWLFQKKLADWIIQDGESEFGYFVYAPDIYAYGPKYTMKYMKMRHPKKDIASFEKKTVTYVLYEPVPGNRGDLSPFDWRKSKFGIYADPVHTEVFPNGYTIEKFVLNEQELLAPVDPDLDTGVFFR